MQDHASPDSHDHNYQLSEAKARVEMEKKWRLGELKVGDRIDAVKSQQVRDLT